jgi:hypothetical protein
VSNIGREIAAANSALTPEQAAGIIYRGLFEHGPKRLSAADRFVAIGTITGGLMEWRRQILLAEANEMDKYKKRCTDLKNELDDLKLRLAILEKER